MAWRKKNLALLCFLVFIIILFLLDTRNISVKLPTIYQRDRSLLRAPPSVTRQTRDQQNLGSYTIIAPASGGLNSSNGSLEVFSRWEKDGASYDDIDIQNFRRKLDEDLFKANLNTTSNKWSLDSDVTLINEHAQRIENLKRVCKDGMFRKSERRKGNLSVFYYSKSHKFAYCKVPKSGSTFWMNVFMILNKGENYSKQISRMSRLEIHVRSNYFKTDPARILHNNIPTVVVSRNPYSRLFSAYVDKVYIPLFWHLFKDVENVTVFPLLYEKEIEVLKQSKMPLSSRLAKYRERFRDRGLLIKKSVKEKVVSVCANNVTFEAFLRFIISEIRSGRQLESHWAPISHLCHPCKFNTYKIVKQESFSADVEHTLQSFGVDISKFEWLKNSLNEHRTENSVPGIVAVIKSKFKRREVNSCITQSEMSRRMWKSFQIQGFISKDLDIPDSLLQADWNSKNSNVTKIVLDAISQKPMTSSERKIQRGFFLKEAYSNISPDVISSLLDIYHLDFAMFNYSMIPP